MITTLTGVTRTSYPHRAIHSFACQAHEGGSLYRGRPGEHLMTDDAWIHDPNEHTNMEHTRAHHAPKWTADSACRVAATLQGAQAGGSERAQPERETERGDVWVHRRFVVTTATNNVVPRWDTRVQRARDAFE